MIELDIERLAYGADSIGRLPDGRVAFISGGCPGDRVAVEIEEDRGRFVRASVREVLRPSPDRVAPPCPYFGVCGGCNWQHVSYAAQTAAKRAAVADSLSRIGHIDVAADTVRQCVPSPREYGYRNKVEFVTDPSSQRLALGYHKAGSEEVVPVDLCLLLPKSLRKAPKALSGALRYLSGEAGLGLTRVGLRTAAHTRDLEVALWTEPGPFPRAAAARVLKDALPATSVVRVLVKGGAKERKVTGVEVLGGKGHWRERLSGRSYAVSAPSFYQVNTAVAEQLVTLVLEALDPNGSDRVLDLYSGVGTFTLPLAELAGEVVAVESAGSAVRDLRRNLEENSLWAEVVGGDAAREIATLGRFDSVLVDPPRSGLDEAVVRALAGMRPTVIAYVSCDPATLARDAARLVESGFRLTDATPVDLFPQTYHVETVARFERTTA